MLASADGKTWESVALLEEEGVDLRDPKLCVTPDGRAMLVMGGSVYEEEELTTRRPRVAFSDDGREWGALRPVLADGDWLWRVTWHARSGVKRSTARGLDSDYLYLVPPDPAEDSGSDSEER